MEEGLGKPWLARRAMPEGVSQRSFPGHRLKVIHPEANRTAAAGYDDGTYHSQSFTTMRTLKIAGSAVGLVLLASPAFAQTVDVQAQINRLLAQIQQLQAQLTAVQVHLTSQPDDYGTAASSGFCPSLSITMQRNARDGSSGGQVSALQRFFAYYYDIDPEEIVTGFFGRITESYVQRFQREQGLPSFGIAGSLTRAAIARVCARGALNGQSSSISPATFPSRLSSSGTSNLTPDQLQMVSPVNNITISVGATIKITYVVGPNIVAGDPAIIERSIVNANTDTMSSGYIPVSQSAGTYSFEWVPNESGMYRAKLTINHNNKSYIVRSGVTTVVGSTISVSDLLTPTVSVNVSPSSVTTGHSALLKWSSTNANRCGLQYGSTEENISVSGTKTVTPSQTTTYFVWCTNDPGDGKDGPAARQNVTLSVSAATLATPSVTFQASPTTVGAVQNSTLSWNTTDANRCVLQYNSGEYSVDTSGSLVVLPSQTTSYRLICTNDPGTGKDGPSTEKTVLVSVASPSCTLTPNKSSYQFGETITFSWTSQNATYVMFQQDTSGKDNLFRPYGDKGNVSGSYTTTANVYGNPSVAMSVYNYYGNSSCSATVSVQ